MSDNVHCSIYIADFPINDLLIWSWIVKHFVYVSLFEYALSRWITDHSFNV